MSGPPSDAISALYAAVLQMEKAAENARAVADQLASGANAARRAYENAAIHTDARLTAFARRIVALHDEAGHAAEERRTVTLTQIIGWAQAALGETTP